MRIVTLFILLLMIAAVTGCGGNTLTNAAVPQFSPVPGTYSTTQKVSITDATPGASIYYTTDGTAPTTSSTKYTGPITVSVSTILQAIASGSNITASSAGVGSYTIVPPAVSNTSYDFGEDLVGATLTRAVATITNNGPTAAPIALSISGDASFTINTDQSCGATIPANSACSVVVVYQPKVSGIQTGSVSAQFTGGPIGPAQVALTGTASAMAAGAVTNTINPQVAQYSLTLPYRGTVTVEFGPDTNYRFSTSAVASGTYGGTVNVLVAGMKATSLYHMRATVTFANGLSFTDIDHKFTTGALPAGIIPTITATTTPGFTPQPGIELLDTILGSAHTAALATDLDGNVIWTYAFPDQQTTSVLYPIKLLANGHMMMGLAPISQSLTGGPPAAGTLVELREIDLAGNIVRQLSMDDLNARLTAAGFKVPQMCLYSHDLTPLPNGHVLVIVAAIQKFTDLIGFPGSTSVVGDVIVDLDQDLNPVWVWNEFEHFDVNRHPLTFPDWTHTNAIVYSQDDGNILVSIRHQNWIVKVNYNDGLGDGSVIWKLGYQGDFTLKNGTDPTDWFYSQHKPSFFSSNTTGVFSLGVMDNGDDREFPDHTNCSTTGGPTLCYTTIPVLQVDERARTATLIFHQILPANLYNSFAGNIEQLDNYNIEYDLADIGSDSDVFEITPKSTPDTVWHMHIAGEHAYRVFRMPSLYPGVQW
jgi:arylsulfate sulfotransferase